MVVCTRGKASSNERRPRNFELENSITIILFCSSLLLFFLQVLYRDIIFIFFYLLSHLAVNLLFNSSYKDEKNELKLYVFYLF